ncbi:hypothetical protein [Rhizobium leguminosarum]|nr:hypothetical protein [Rhizobium leguminosarum]
MTISMDIESGARPASASSPAPFEEGIAEFYETLPVSALIVVGRAP